MANSLTSSGLTCGSGTMKNFISAISSSAVGVGRKTFSRPAAVQTTISTTIGAVTLYRRNDSNPITLPSTGNYIAGSVPVSEPSFALEFGGSYSSQIYAGGSRIPYYDGGTFSVIIRIQ